MPASKNKKVAKSSVISISSSEPQSPSDTVDVSSDSSVPASPILSKRLQKASASAQKKGNTHKRQASDTNNQSNSPSKKARNNKKGSPMWDIERPSRSPSPADAPPVTITNTTGRRLFASTRDRSPTFGRFDEDNDNDGEKLQESPIIHKKRQSIPSEKARYMLDEGEVSAPAKTGSQSKTTKASAKAASKVKVPIEEEEAPVSNSRKKKTATKPTQRQLDEENSDDNVKRNATYRKTGKAKKEETPSEEAEEDAVPSEEDMHQRKKQNYYHSNQDSKINTTSRNKMQAGYTLPEAPELQYKPIALEPFLYLSKEPSVSDMQALYLEAVYTKLLAASDNKYGPSNLLRCYVFIGTETVLNPARADADHVTVYRDNTGHGRIISANAINKSTAPSTLFISSACVAKCELVVPGKNTSSSTPSDIKKIGVWIMGEELDPMMAFFGRVYNKRYFWTHYYNDILTFQTQRSVENQWQATPGTSSPKKPSGLFGPRTPAKISSHVAPRANHPHFLKFTDQVPIYDTRSVNFKFTAESISRLSELPRYNSGISDLNESAIVTLGYTVNTYPYTNQANSAAMPEQNWALSFNIHFVLFHGDPAKNTTSKEQNVV